MAAKVAPRGGAAGLTQRRKTYRILREDTADTLSPLSRTLFELHHEGKSAASSKQLEDVGVTYPEQVRAAGLAGSPMTARAPCELQRLQRPSAGGLRAPPLTPKSRAGARPGDERPVRGDLGGHDHHRAHAPGGIRGECIHAPPRLLQHLHRAGHGASEVHLQRAASVFRVLLHRCAPAPAAPAPRPPSTHWTSGGPTRMCQWSPPASFLTAPPAGDGEGSTAARSLGSRAW